MERVEKDEDWTLMCPDECPDLENLVGLAFRKKYESYEHECKGKKTIKAQTLWRLMVESQIETGMPYMM